MARPLAQWRTPKSCASCGIKFVPKKPHRIACSAACGVKVRRPAKARPTPPPRHRCPVCDGGFRLSYGGQRTCSRVCAAALRFGRDRGRSPLGPWVLACAACSGQFTTHRPNAKYCTARCRLTGVGVRVNSLYGLACQSGWVGARWRELLVGYLRERDGGACRICRMAIRFDLPSGPRGDPSGEGPSVDHVVPRSHGGGDDLSNLRLAHWSCNRNRGAGGGNEQLMLFG